MDATIRAGITFLEAQGWTPRRAARALAEYEAEAARSGPGSRASRELQSRAWFALDATLQGFLGDMRHRVDRYVEFGGNRGDVRAQCLLALAEEARSLMSREPSAALFQAA